MKHKFSSFLTQKGRWLTAILFLLTFSIGQMWGTATNFHDFVAAGDTIIDLEGSGSTPSAKFTAVNNTDWASVSTSAKNATVKRINPSTGATATSTSNVYGTKLSSSNKTILKVQGVTGVSYYIGGGSSRKGYLNVEADEGDKRAQVESAALSNTCAVMTCTLDKDSSYTLTLSASGDIFCYAIKITVASKCNDPGTALSLSSDAPATIYAGREITFSTSGGNGGSITIAGAASETISENKWTATEGVHTFTASQAKNGNYCAQEAELKLTVLAATPVSAVTVNGPANGYKNNEVIFAATAANATQYRWTVDGVVQGSDSAKLHFTPTESKTYSIVCEARNAYNSDWIASTAHSLTVTSLYGELIRATLTGGNNATMTGIIGGTFDSNLGSGKYKLDKNVYMGVQLASGSFQEGDTVIVSMTTAGSNYPCLFADKERNTLLYLATETSSALVYKMVLPAAANNKNTVYLSRDNDVTYKWNPVVAYISVVRPMPVKSTAYDLTAVKINGTPISAANLAVLKTADAYLLDLATEYPEGPTVKFARQTTNTYEDDSQKVLNDTITVTATEVSSKWQAQATIGTITYTVKMAKSAATAKVYYYDGATKLGEETVAINGNPVEAGDYDDKNLASFVGWYNNSDLAEEHKIANIAALVVTKDTTVYGKWNPEYATSINIEQWTLTNGAGIGATTKTSALISAIGSHNFAHNLAWVNKNLELDSLNDDPSKDNRNYAYLGLKVKVGGKMVDFRLQNGQTVKVKFGATGNYPQVALNGGSYADMSLTDNVWTYTADGDAYISIKTPNNNAVIFKQIMINEDLQTVTLPWRVTYDANGGTCGTASVEWSGAALILPDVTPADADHTFAGWYDEVSGGSLIGAAGASYTPTDNTTLHAHFAPVEYAIAYDGNGATSGSMVAGAAGWGTLVTPATNAFEKTGHIFSGWEITKTEDGSATGITFSAGKFEMPKYDVTLVAQWEDVSKVAVIVETNVKYESLADAITAAEAGQTIQLLQNIEQENGVAIAKNLTLDLNGKTYTCTSGSNVNSRAIKITAGNVTIQNGSIIAVPTANFEGGAYGPLRIEGASTNVTLEDLTLQNGRHYGLGIKLVEGYLRMEDCTVISENGGGGLEVAGTADVINCTFTQTGLDNAHAWISTCLATCDNGVLNVQGGTYTSDHYSMYVYTSGGEMDVESGNFTGDVVNKVTLSSYPDAVGTVNISGGSFEGAGGNPIQFTIDETGKTSIAISGGSFDAPVENEYCAPGYVPSPADPVTGKYSVEPKDGVEIIGAVVTGNTTATVTGLYKGTATVNLNSKKIDSGKYIYVTLKEGYTFEENDVLIVDVNAKSNIGTSALEITTGVGNIDGAVWKTLASDDYATGDNIISLEGIAANQTSIGLKRSDNQNAKINGLRVLRPMKPMLTAITIDGRDGVIDEANKTVAVQIPYEADLAALTVVPTIVWNEAAATNSIVVNDGGAWVESPSTNSYKLTDKDGDYTIYTITLTRDVLKHTVSFNTHGGSAVANELVVHGGYLAAAPADPEKEENVFKHWAETEDGEAVDVTTVQINADKTFHAVWEAEPAGIKLFNGNVLNTTNFISAAATTIEISEVEYPCLVAFASNRTSLAGAKQGDLVMYSATTDAAKIKFDLYNANASAKTAYVWLVEEGDAEATQLDAIEVAGTTRVKTAYYEFNGTKNRTVYLTSGSKADIKVLQAKVIESGSAIKQFGDAGYTLKLNQGRIAAASAVQFEGATVNVSSEYAVLNNSNLSTKSYIKFTTTVDKMILHVEKSGGKFYVSQDPEDKGTIYNANADVELTPAGEWYLGSETSGSAASFTNIAFIAPKCEQPTVADMSDVELCAGDAYTALAVSASVSDEGTLHYAWFKEAGATDEAVGTDAASFTPEADGEYYVIVTNQKTGYSDNSKTSNTISVEHFAAAVITTAPADVAKAVGEEATLSVVATGKNCTYEWFTCDDALGTNPVAIVPAETEASLTVTVAAGEQYYMVVVSSDCGAPVSAVAKVAEWRELTPANVTGSKTWDWTSAAWNGITGDIAFANTGVEELMANVNAKVPCVDGANGFRSDMLYGTGQYVWRSGNKFFQGTKIRFITTVPGKLVVRYRNTSGSTNTRTIKITNNGEVLPADGTNTTNSFKNTNPMVVKAGEVIIEGIASEENGLTRIEKIIFDADLAPTQAEEATLGGYERDVTEGRYGTICLPKDGIMVGAAIFEIAYFDVSSSKIFFDEIVNGVMEAGVPYIFLPREGATQLGVYYTDAVNAPAGTYYTDGTTPASTSKNGLVGFIGEAEDDYFDIPDGVGNYIIQNNQYREVPAGAWARVKSNRAYIHFADVPTNVVAPLPGRRRMSIGLGAPQNPTGMDELNAADAPVKVMINGELFILRGEKMYDATGRLVK